MVQIMACKCHLIGTQAITWNRNAHSYNFVVNMVKCVDIWSFISSQEGLNMLVHADWQDP